MVVLSSTGASSYHNCCINSHQFGIFRIYPRRTAITSPYTIKRLVFTTEKGMRKTELPGSDPW
jgi:hypothetical protein